MPQVTFEQVLSQVESLMTEDKAKLRDYLNEQIEKDKAMEAARAPVIDTSLQDSETESLRARARAASLRDLSSEHQWLHEHRDEYAGQWVALKGDQLIHHSTNAKEVFAAAKAVGMLETLVVLVEPRRDYPIINLG
ncbi:MAG: DUF5678 domain-containing protein [Blastocatellia bacterium]